MPPISHVLLIDADPGVLAALCETVNMQLGHFTLEICHSGAEALESIHSTPYDTIISEAVLPDLHGLDLLRLVQQTRHDAPVILISGHADRVSMAHALAAGASDFLAKPFERPVFMETIRGTLHVSRLRQLLACHESALTRGQDRYLQSIERVSERTERRRLDVTLCEDSVLQQQADQRFKDFTHTETRHVARLAEFLFRTTEAHRQTSAQLKMVQDTVRRRAWRRVGTMSP